MAVSRVNVSIKRKNAEAALKAAKQDITERFKELNSVYSLSELVDKHPDDVHKILQAVVAILPAAFNFPEDACVRIRAGNESYESKAFKETKCGLSVPISAKGEKTASIDVFYTKPHSFLKEEKKLLHVFSERLGKVIARVGLTKALRADDARFKGLFESSNDAIFIADGETKKLVDCNRKAEELLGRPKAQILSMRADELHPKDMVKETMEGFKRQAQGKIAIIKTEVLAKSGKRIPIEISGATFWVEGKPYMAGNFRDITERKKAEDAVKASEARFKEIFESSNDAIFVADVGTKKLVDCNRKAEELVGRPKAQILSMRADELHPKDRVKETMEGFSKQAKGELDIIESEVLTKSGKRIPVEINSAAFAAGKENYVIGIFRDITERKAAEKLQQEYSAKLEKAVAERTAELETKLKELEDFKEFAVGRELDMIALKKELEALKRTSGASRAAGQ